MAQLVERLLPTLKVHGSNSVISSFLFTVNCIEKTKIKKKGTGTDSNLAFLWVAKIQFPKEEKILRKRRDRGIEQRKGSKLRKGKYQKDEHSFKLKKID